MTHFMLNAQSSDFLFMLNIDSLFFCVINLRIDVKIDIGIRSQIWNRNIFVKLTGFISLLI